jgi:hypothetical protein
LTLGNFPDLIRANRHLRDQVIRELATLPTAAEFISANSPADPAILALRSLSPAPSIAEPA